MAYDRCFVCKSSSSCSRSSRRQSRNGTNKRELKTKIHVAVDALGMPFQFDVTSGAVADCVCAQDLIAGIFPKYLLADRGYETQAIIEYCNRV